MCAGSASIGCIAGRIKLLAVLNERLKNTGQSNNFSVEAEPMRFRRIARGHSAHNPPDLIYAASVILGCNSICTNYTLRVLRPRPAVSPSEY